MWIVGGRNGGDDTSELISAGSAPFSGPKLSFPIHSHCMVKFREDAIYIIGGFQQMAISNQVWIVDPTKSINDPSIKMEMKKGPPLKQARYNMACGIYNDLGTMKLIVAGGQYQSGESSDSVEVFDPLPSQKWKYGK